MTASTIRPLPPNRLVPPMTAAPTAYSRVCGATGRAATTELSRLASRTPATAARVEQIMKQDSLIRGHVDAGAARRLGVAADGVDVPAPACGSAGRSGRPAGTER